MSTTAEAIAPWAEPIPHHEVRRRAGLTLAALLGFYFVVAYVLMPAAWDLRVHDHPNLDGLTTIVYTKSGIPGDPLNVGLIGTEEQVKKVLVDAGWHPADALSIRADLKIAEATVLDKSYADAPVSSLYFEGRKEDLAYEQQIGNDPKRRNHVRFWKTKRVDPADGRPIWLGSATLDVRVGLSHTTGQITHHIGADVDAERDHLMQSLEKTGEVSLYPELGFHKKLSGKNGGGDPWHTDGTLEMGVIKATE